MIAPIDLHHGCYYQLEGETYRLTLEKAPRFIHVNYSGIMVYTTDLRAKQFEPIPIAPKWLDRLQFYGYSAVCERIGIWEKGRFGIVFMKNAWWLNTDDFNSELKYIHEIQLLCPALTGIIISWNTDHSNTFPVQ